VIAASISVIVLGGAAAITYFLHVNPRRAK
jgi:hypothetical protein